MKNEEQLLTSIASDRVNQSRKRQDKQWGRSTIEVDGEVLEVLFPQETA